MLKKGTCGDSVLGLVRNAVVNGSAGWAEVAPETPVCCRAVPAVRSVPGREYAALVAARQSWSVTEAGVPILDTVQDKYGIRGLHFQPKDAAAAMSEVWDAAVAAFPPRGENTIDIVICCGWNCDGQLVPLECFAAAMAERTSPT